MTKTSAMQQNILTISVAFGKLNRMDPSGPVYAKLCSLLDRCDDDALKVVHEAKIKFVSSLAFNRMIRRGLVKVGA